MFDYSTYLGGTSTDQSYDIAVDSSGNAYVAGVTSSTNFPTFNAYQSSPAGNGDLFIIKLDPTGSSLVYSTYLGGSGPDGVGGPTSGPRIAVDSSGNAYITATISNQPPLFYPTTTNALPSSPGGGVQAVVTKLDANGSSLLYSTFLNGLAPGPVFSGSLVVDSAENAYVTGQAPPGLPTTANAYASCVSNEVFVMKLNTTSPTSVPPLYSTCLGPGWGTSIAVDTGKKIYVTGQALSGFPTTANAFATTMTGSDDLFVAKLNPVLLGSASLLYSTYFGGNGIGSPGDRVADLALDDSGYVYITGDTTSSDFPVKNAYQATQNNASRDAFVAKFDPAALTGPASLVSR